MSARLHTALSDTPLDVAAAHRFVADPAAGATVVFTGVVRNHADGRPVLRLDYEAYAEQVRAVLADVAAAAAAKWPDVLAVYVAHRTGTLEVGEPAVVVAVSAPHRQEAFEAGRYTIDEVKAHAPIWKREHWADGGAHWPGTD